MNAGRRAVIDVGTNSIKLLVGEIRGHEVHPYLEESKQTRLGQGFYPDHVLQHGPIEQTARAVAEFVQKARQAGAAQPRVVATSAARDAKNQTELTSAIENACGVPVRVLSGEQEADYAFRGVTSDSRLAREPLLLMDVGGGSTEFILGQGEHKHFASSFNLGTVRLLNQLHLGEPPAAEQLNACRTKVLAFLEQRVKPKLEPALKEIPGSTGAAESLQLVGTGGTASILGAMEARLTGFNREQIEQVRLSRVQLHRRVDQLWSLPLDERKQIPGLPPNRADVILTGAAIFEAVMQCFALKELRISTRGLRFAVLMDEI